MLLDSGKWDEGELSRCDFGVAEFSASCVGVQPGPNSRFYPVAGTTSACGGSRLKRKEWKIAGIGLVKDKGDPRELLAGMWQMCDDLLFCHFCLGLKSLPLLEINQIYVYLILLKKDLMLVMK